MQQLNNEESKNLERYNIDYLSSHSHILSNILIETDFLKSLLNEFLRNLL